MRFDLVVRGGRVVSPGTARVTDIGVRDGQISVLGDLSGVDSARTIDAAGLTVFSGGVDPHTHIRWPFLDATSHDDFRTASIAAFHGGTTSVVDWALPADRSALAGVRRRQNEATGDGVLVDFALHCVLGPDLARGYDEVPDVVEQGCPTFKCYLTYRRRGLLTDDAKLVRALRAVAAAGGIVGVHAENPALHETTEAELRAAGKQDAMHFRAAKDNLVEAEAIHRAIFLAEQAGAPLMIQHVSTREGVELVRTARRRGLPVFAETCPHYLVLTDEVYEGPLGRRYLCSPPIKSTEDQEALWAGLADGTISIVGADHCAFTVAQKEAPASAFDAPNGLPGVETRLPLLYSHGVAAGRLSEARFSEVIAENPARVAGIHSRKGILAVGADADLVIIDPAARRTITATRLHQDTDWTPYEGVEVRGWPKYTIRRGEVVIDDGRYVEPADTGQFLAGMPHGFDTVR
ncbi:dihydropyrimidinase [Actinophytocola sp.]|uniref:dihydropyrimidinase n=1 Tax=Actinophytocola sp. TaxID=1872138 RepID=UPI003D6BDE09